MLALNYKIKFSVFNSSLRVNDQFSKLQTAAVALLQSDTTDADPDTDDDEDPGLTESNWIIIIFYKKIRIQYYLTYCDGY